MNLACKDILAALQSDFGALWHCKTLGETLEIVTPYLLPTHANLSVFITERDSRIIVTDGGRMEPYLDDDMGVCIEHFDGYRDHLMSCHGVRRHEGNDDRVFYFKDTTETRLISSLVFDLANFATAWASAAANSGAAVKEEQETTMRFAEQADDYLKSILPIDSTIAFRNELREVKSVRFSAVIHYHNRLCLISYVTGSNTHVFARNVSYVKDNFEMAWESSLKPFIAATIPLIDNNANGYVPQSEGLNMRLERLQSSSQSESVLWTHKEQMLSLVGSSNGFWLRSRQ